MKAFVVAVSLLALARCVHPGEAPRSLVGLWGGQGIGLDIEGGVAAVQYDCAAGTIDQALPPQGPFSVQGTHRAGQVGQVRVGQIFTAQQATYSGQVIKDQMTLSVRLEDGTELGPFTLDYGVAPVLTRCE
jgi:hypothetical protein